MDIISTYRLQFHKGFTFRDAAAIIPYLKELGITHIYASPYLKAVAGSTHGYDVIDHNQLNPEIGSPDDYNHFVTTLTNHGLSHILDTVPNHMGVDTNDNQWWNDLLTHGQQSKYSNYFDIEWTSLAPRQQLAGKVLLPVLGEPLGQALEKNLLQLKSEANQHFILYHTRRFPIDPHSKTNQDLPSLLQSQHYRLAFWKVAADEINYRRFFDISSLAALQMQRQEVFNAAHEFTFKLIADGKVAGLRVDHPDGLLDPKQYFQRLQEKFAASCPNQAASDKPLFVSVEKILNGDEQLRDDWPVAGTSGYDFIYAINDLFIDSKNESAITEIYTNFIDDRTDFAACVFRNKCLVLDTSMNAELQSLTNRLDALAQLDLSSQDFTRRQLQATLRELIASFPVYRSYISSEPITESDIAVMDQAISQAIARNPKIDQSALTFIRDTVLLRNPIAPSIRPRQLDFAQHFQQLTAPVNAKGIEDSTFYIYNRLTSLNEVGGDPSRFGRTPQAIHQYLSHRQAHWPLSLSTLSTHDTKRSEDVRARLNVLSEIPAEWVQHLQQWKTLNADIAINIYPNDQYLLYQTLIGAWPHQPMDDPSSRQFTTRISAYMQKALREAKQRTSWTNPNEAYESAVSKLIEQLLNSKTSQPFLADFLPFQNKISYLGMLNSLSQTVLRLTAPGISDTYQGTELWDLSLVDPDNRRPVNYQSRQEIIIAFRAQKKPAPLIENLMASMKDGRIKLWIIRQLLQYRKTTPDLFLNGSYEPIPAYGQRAGNIFAFARVFDKRCVIVVVPRLLASLVNTDKWGNQNWADTHITFPQNSQSKSWTNILTGKQLNINQDRTIPISQLIHDFPVAVLATHSQA